MIAIILSLSLMGLVYYEELLYLQTKMIMSVSLSRHQIIMHI